MLAANTAQLLLPIGKISDLRFQLQQEHRSNNSNAQLREAIFA
jgi:hypothetical protein